MKKQELSISLETVKQGKIYTGISFPEANAHYCRGKLLAAWSGSQH